MQATQLGIYSYKKNEDWALTAETAWHSMSFEKLPKVAVCTKYGSMWKYTNCKIQYWGYRNDKPWEVAFYEY